ncbi:MAG TPA: aminotransferase class I/II-fold pyridoxal phosphate-dependent enzyme [Candidatus Brocadiia bacterium]|nr:aminotransferase class I/II-fold pyridoxal phosphate-dependent enzyme [Candidatus Brocadiia bacterium]
MSDKSPVTLSRRLDRLPPYLFARLNALRHQKRRDGDDVIDLGMGNPNDPPPQEVVDKLCEAVQKPKNHRYSVSAEGIMSLKRELAVHYEKVRGVALNPEDEIVCTIGSKEGLSHMALALMDSGDTAVVATPAFPIHIHSVTLAGGSVLSVPMAATDKLASSIANVLEMVRPKPKFILLNFPHNPTTAVADRDFFSEMVGLANKHGVMIVHDYAYADTVFDGYEAPSFLSVPGAKNVGVEFSTMSKAFSMAGWRVGFCVGNRKMVKALAQIKGYYDYGIFQPVQIASIIALRHCREHSRELAQVYQGRRDTLCRGLERIGWPVDWPKATMFLWARIPEQYRNIGSFEFALKLLNEANVAVSPGSSFGQGGDEYVRFALVENELRLKQAVRQIGYCLKLAPGRQEKQPEIP